MPIYCGGKKISSLYYGGKKIASAWYGGKCVYRALTYLKTPVERWRFQASENHSSIVAYDNGVFVGTDVGKVYKLDEENTTLWTWAGSAEQITAMAYKNGKLLLGDNQGNINIVSADGKAVWSTQVAGSIGHIDMDFNDNVYATIGNKLTKVTSDKTVAWVYSVPDSVVKGTILCVAVANDGSSYIGGEQFAFKISLGGKLAWAYDTTNVARDVRIHGNQHALWSLSSGGPSLIVETDSDGKEVFRHQFIYGDFEIISAVDKSGDMYVAGYNLLKNESITKLDASGNVLAEIPLDNNMVRAITVDSDYNIYWWDGNGKNPIICIQTVELPIVP